MSPETAKLLVRGNLISHPTRGVATVAGPACPSKEWKVVQGPQEIAASRSDATLKGRDAACLRKESKSNKSRILREYV